VRDETDFSDILLIADSQKTYFIETLNGKVTIIERNNGSFASTNHMRMIYGAVGFEHNHSTYLRLERAETILANNPTHAGVGDLLRDKHYGESVWSICRSKNTTVPEEDDFYTQASVIFNIPAPKDSEGKCDPIIEYVINGNPSERNKGVIWRPFSSNYKTPVEYIGKGGI
jgi:hypothetical protein